MVCSVSEVGHVSVVCLGTTRYDQLSMQSGLCQIFGKKKLN